MRSFVSERRLQIAGNIAIVLLVVCPNLGPAVGADSYIDQHGLRFSQSSITLVRGSTLHFRNGDDVPHNIMVLDANDEARDEGLQKPGEVISAKFDEAGEFQIRCAIHPKMKMTVAVSGQ
jgi:plastocyanin